MRTRTVEVIVCISYGSDNGAWHVIPTEVDFDLPQEEAEKLAIEQVEKTIDHRIWVAHTGIYCYWSDDAARELWEEEEWEQEVQ